MKCKARGVVVGSLLTSVALAYLAVRSHWMPDHNVARMSHGDSVSPCVVSPWSPWSPCNCQSQSAAAPAQSVRSRHLVLPTTPQCVTVNLRQAKRCAECTGAAWTAAAAVQVGGHPGVRLDPTARCQPGPWSSWGPCRTVCGFGNRNRTRVLQGPGCFEPGVDMPDIEHSACPEPRPPCGVRVVAATATAAAVAMAPTSAPLLGCGDLARIVLQDAEPFARGFTKAVWRGTLNDTPMVIKRPFDEASARRFVKSTAWETAWLKRYRARPEFIQFYGSCRDSGVNQTYEAVEGALTKWEFVMNGTTTVVPWCVRLQLAVQVAKLVRLLHTLGLMHCDWKYDQLAIDLSGRVKIADVKSIRWLRDHTLPYHSDRHCGTRIVNGTASVRGCNTCMKQLDLPVEHTCNTTTGRCRGFDVLSLVSATGQSVFTPLLIDHLSDPPHRDFSTQVKQLIDGMTQRVPDNRWPIDRVLSGLAALEDRFRAKSCLDHVDMSTILRTAYHEMIASRKARCTKRYC
eukprot:m.202528 g.202528  ORF g.202528 m.202528 type:complete len:514 (-) comp21794_c0_seq1:82-1623(-)